MNIEVRPTKTTAEAALAQAYANAKESLPGGEALLAQRDAAFGQFAAGGLPHRRIEQWKYTDLRAFMRDAMPLAGPPGAEAQEKAAAAGAAFAALGARRLVFVDGAFVAALSDLTDLEEGLAITSLSDALAKGVPEVMERLGAAGPADADLAFSLNTAFMGDGAVITMAPEAKGRRPLHLVFASSGEATATFTRSLVSVGAGAQLSLIESHEGPDGVAYQLNSALDVTVGEGAILDHVKCGHEGDQAIHVSTLIAALGKDALLRDLALVAGGAMVRNQLFVTCLGEGAIVDLRGATMLGGRQHADTTLVLDHAIGGCQSRELFKSVLDGDSRCVFQGKIVVRKDAQKTDGRMMTQALLLSETAEADAKPELEIFADDVQCGHGATTGDVDATLKFYLMARGIPEKEAETLLIQAFIGEVIDGVESEPLREALMSVVLSRLAERA